MRRRGWKKLNVGFEAEPNSPGARVTVKGTCVELRFLLSPLTYDGIEEEEARLTFDGVQTFRYAPDENDEGITRGKSRFGYQGLEGDFFELSPPDGPQEFPADRVDLSNEALDGLKHFVYFLKDGTFECLALGYRFERLGPSGA